MWKVWSDIGMWLAVVVSIIGKEVRHKIFFNQALEQPSSI